MEAERQMTVHGAPAALESWVQTLSDPGIEGWSRATEVERKVRIRPELRWPICLIWSGEGDHPRTALFLKPLSDEEIAVTNLVPLDRRKLALDDRQAVLDAFRSALIDPRGDELEVGKRLSSAGLVEQLSARALTRFLAFVRTADKAILHSELGLPRWYDFLIHLHREKTRPRWEILENALKDEAFSQEVIGQLRKVYDFADDLLSRYDASWGDE
jgi:hypothetical protein